MDRAKNKAQFAQILGLIGQARRAVICTHLSPDGDALGSMLALTSLVSRLGVRAVAVCQDPVPAYLKFLPGSADIRLPAEITGESFDLALSIDASDFQRLGTAGAAFLSAPVRAQMDHHRTNTRFADVNLVLDDLPASGSLMCRMMDAAGFELTQDEAVCLYTAITTDTGNLCFGNVSDETFEQLASLMRAGLPLTDTARQLHLMREKEQVLMLGRALQSLRFYCGGRLTMMRLTRRDYEECGADISHTDKIVNYGLYMPGVQIACLAHEREDGVKFSLRSIAPREVSGIALAFGGGGHAQAAGCSIQAPLDQAMEMVREATERELNT